MPSRRHKHGMTKTMGHLGMRTGMRRLLTLQVTISLIIWPSIGNDVILFETHDTSALHNSDSLSSSSSSSGILYCYKCDYEKVWHFYSESENGRTYYFKRDCTSQCYPGCTPLDDMENRFVSCTSCCQYDYCNMDNAAMTSATPKLVSTFGALIAMVVRNL
ncbi:unnamed protein product [Soboliphyme baturini]|uniref:Toxin_TOLIP domain-containing protein n=1 Tax=Soboliphyme baturini TaxID=241478 RepID=A0A183IRI1_9BILA|nr:unnamed protein product [Soboliphyme baturini]